MEFQSTVATAAQNTKCREVLLKEVMLNTNWSRA